MPAGSLDLDIHARRQAQLVECLDRFGRGLHDVDQPLVRADLELLASLLIDVRAGQHRIALDARGERDWPMYFTVGPLRSVDDFRRTLIEDRVIVGFHPDANDFLRMTRHNRSLKKSRRYALAISDT